MLSPQSLVGRTLGGQYRVDRLLGRGGFGAVFAAWDTVLDRPVAVKVIAHVAAERLANRFRREAQVQARLRHPTTVRLLAFGEDDGLHFMVQELVDGRTLRAEVEDGGPLSPARARRIFGQLLEALDEAHDIGVVHRDLKPDNIMLVEGRRGEEARLLDFGIAKIVDDEGEALTASGMMVGTAAWMSPEQAESLPVTPQSDLYSLGCVLYFTLSGRRPFDGTALQLVLAHSRSDPPPLPDDVPAELAAVVLRAMRKQPAARFADAAEMHRALQGKDADGMAETGAHLPATLMVGGADRLPPPLDPSSSDPWPPPVHASAATLSTVSPVVAADTEPSASFESSDTVDPDLSAPTPRPAPPRDRRRPGPLSGLVILLAIGGLALLAFGPLFEPRGTPPEPDAQATVLTQTVDHGPPKEARAPADATPTDATPADAAPSIDAAARKAPATRPATRDAARDARARFDRALRRCDCADAERRLDDLDRDARTRWRAACARAEGSTPAGRCGRELLARLEAAMATCPCHGDTNKALVERLRTGFGIDRERAWSHRCTIPGLPNSCLSPMQ